MTSRNYCFTLFFWGNDEVTAEEHAVYEAQRLGDIFSDGLFKFVIINVEECPDTHRVHWQGYLELTRPVRFAAIKRLVPLLDTAHFEPRRGTREQAIEYSSKTESQLAGPFKHGDEHTTQGHRSDLDELAAAALAGQSVSDIAKSFPTAFIRYHGGVNALIAATTSAPIPETAFVPNTWQAHLLALLSAPADDRQIIWVKDTTGGRGKTRLATHLTKNHGAQVLGGKLADMAYAWCMQPSRIACFDITRAAADCSAHLYSMGEQLKSGRVFTTKYHSRTCHFAPPHVVYFSNQDWDRRFFSLDRVLEINLQDPQWT